MSPKEKKEFISDAVKLIKTIRNQKSGKINEISEEEMEKQLSSLKSIAMRAQKKWEKMQEIKKSDLNEDDPKKDYSGYRIKDPTHPRALRNLKPTDDPKELQKRQIRMQLEKAMKRAPTGWYDQWLWNTIPVGVAVRDWKTGDEYVVSVKKNYLIPDKTNKENEPRQVQKTEYVASAAPEAAVWVVSLALLLRLLLAVI